MLFSRIPWVQAVLVLLSLSVLCLALLRVGTVYTSPDPKVQALEHEVIDERTLLYLGVAGALLLLRDVKSLAYGDLKLDFERQLSEVKTVAENAQAVATSKGGECSPDIADGLSPATTAVVSMQPGCVEDDPWKGVFGGFSKSRNRELSAEILPGSTPMHSRIRLGVQSTKPDSDPLRGSVQFFLHSSFRNDRPVVRVSPAGLAELSIDAWGAFTVGAVADAGLTHLELDLAEHPDAPADFRAR